MRRLWAWVRAKCHAWAEWVDGLPPEVQAEIVRQQNRQP